MLHSWAGAKSGETALSTLKRGAQSGSLQICEARRCPRAEIVRNAILRWTAYKVHPMAKIARHRHALLVCAALAALQCQSPAPIETAGRLEPTSAPHSQSADADANAATQSTLRVSVVAPADASGILVLGWYTEDEAPKVKPPGHPSGELLAKLLPRLSARKAAALKAGEKHVFELESDAEAAHALALLVQPGQLWPAIFGHAPAGNFVGSAPVSTRPWPHANRIATVNLAPIPERGGPSRERCQGDRLSLLLVDSPEVAGRVGNRSVRRICAYLPPSYATDRRRRYPVAYLLPGLASTDTSYLSGDKSLTDAADALAKKTGREAILVGVDTSTKSGSTYLVDSAQSGNWERFLVDRVVKRVDKEFRTIKSSEARALIGQSTGGFNAVSYGLRHSDTFTVIGASAPDGLDLESWLVADGRARPLWLAWARLEDAVGGAGQMISYAVDWSPDPKGKHGLRWPFSLQSGSVEATTLARWRAHSPLGLLDDPAIQKNVKERLSKRVRIAVAVGDEFDLHRPALAFSKRLTELGIEHTFSSESGGHFEGSRDRLRAALEFSLGLMPQKVVSAGR